MAISALQKKARGRPAGSSNKRVKSPMPRKYDGCESPLAGKEGNHVFINAGRPSERCRNCGCEHADITAWRRQQIEHGDACGHPYVNQGVWSLREYRKYMSK